MLELISIGERKRVKMHMLNVVGTVRVDGLGKREQLICHITEDERTKSKSLTVGYGGIEFTIPIEQIKEHL